MVKHRGGCHTKQWQKTHCNHIVTILIKLQDRYWTILVLLGYVIWTKHESSLPHFL